MSTINGINDHVRNVCKIGQGKVCCRYLVIGRSGFECVKQTDMKEYIDARVNMGTMVACSDNCDGKEINALNTIIIQP